MESLRLTYERKHKDLIAEIDFLERENQKLKAKFGVTDDEAVISLDDDEEDYSEYTGEECSATE